MDNNILGSLLMLLFAGGFYVYMSYAQQVIANKIGTSNSWFAWVPVLNVYLTIKMAGKPVWWILLYFVPLVNLIVFALIWMKIAAALNKSQWIGILMLLVPINLLVLGYLAFWDNSPTSSVPTAIPATLQTEERPSETPTANLTQSSPAVGISNPENQDSNQNTAQ